MISNSLRFSTTKLPDANNKGSKDGIKPPEWEFSILRGVVGQCQNPYLQTTQSHFSLLNTGSLISSKIKSTNDFGTVQWDGKNSSEAKLLFVPRHVKTQEGDTIVTSRIQCSFPGEILIGVISKVALDEKDANYLNLTVKLSTDFSKVNYVYFVENILYDELDSLYRQSEIPNEY